MSSILFSIESYAKPSGVSPGGPPKLSNTEWLRVSYEKSEDELLSLFYRDLPKLEDQASEIAIYEVKTVGTLPKDHFKRLRSKLERILLTSKRLKLKRCSSCDEARILRSENGEIKYETRSTDPSRPARVASEIGASHLLYIELVFSSEDLQLQAQLVQPEKSQIVWSKNYSIADYTQIREDANLSGPNEISASDSLSKVIMGEIAFSFGMSAGVFVLPNLRVGDGVGYSPLPSFDLYVGERFDRGRRTFGFTFGLAAGSSDKSSIGAKGDPVNLLLRLGPKFTYVFNPLNTTSAQYGLAVEGGIAIPDISAVTAYVGVGPEIKMINRYSLSVMPMYFVPADARTPSVRMPHQLGGSVIGGDYLGKFGGFGALAKFIISW